MSNSNNRVNIDNEINWEEVVKKEARGIDNADFGEVQEIVLHYILTEKGLMSKEKFYLPTELVEGFDGDKLRFNISEEEANEKFKRATSPSVEEYAIYKKKKITANDDVNKQDNSKTISNSLESNISLSKEKEPIGEVKSEQEQKNELVDKEIEDKARVEEKEAVRLEDERKAQSISQQIQDKAKMEAERKAQGIIQQAEEKARHEAERRVKGITKEIEDKARVEDKEKRISNQGITKIIDYYPQEEYIKTKINNNDYKNNIFFGPFTTSINLWQNYSKIWLNLYEQTVNNNIAMTRDFANTISKSWIGSNNWFKNTN